MGCIEDLRWCLLVWAAVVGLALGQNLDTRWPVVRTGPGGSMFGYSVALHKEGSDNWLLVGAPKAQTTQPDVEEGGAVYKCPVFPLAERDTCQQIPFDTTGHTVDSRGDQVADKSFQWFGATVKSSGPGGRVMACAPRYTWFYRAELKDDERAPVGVCYISANNFTSFFEYSPCMTDDVKLQSFKKITHCQAGFSGEIAEDNSIAVLGAVGSYFLQGQIYIQSLVSAEEPLSTPELDPVNDDSYSGFSVAIGEFTGDNQRDYAVGAPRGNSLRGRVILLDSILDSLNAFSGEQIASYFGHAVIAEDVNGDGLDDVIVGAPMFADKKASTDKWEAGRVYIYYQNQDHSFSEPSTITGQMIRARLGTAIASLGDVNQDGFNDIAIGAPYQGENQRGVVFIHLGSADGLRLTSSQVLTPADFGLKDATSFGFSLSGGLDVDDNNYPDLLIGAEESNLAVLARARPVILLKSFLSINPEGINLNNKSHQLPDGSHATSFEITYCLTYQGKHLPATADIQYMLSLDSLQMVSPRALFANGSAQGSSRHTSKMTLTKDDKWCSVTLAYVRTGIRDKLRPISVNLKYALNDEDAVFQPYELQPFLNSDSSSITTKQVYINNNCKNNVCIPDLELTATASTTELNIGGSDAVTINVVVTNKGEDAFLAMLKVVVPKGLQFVRVVRKRADFSVTCSNDKVADTITCDIGNPLMHNYQVDFGLKFSSFQLGGDKSSVVFALSATSENLEASPDKMTNNYVNITQRVKALVDLDLLGRSIPAQVAYTPEGKINQAITKDNEAGPLVVHVYEVSNKGPSDAGMISLEVSWPMVDEDDNYLLYLIDIEPSPGALCRESGVFNPLNLTLEENQLGNMTIGSNGDTYSPRRRRRQSEQPLPQVGSIGCSSGNCLSIRCTIQELKGGKSEVIKFTSRLWNQTFVEATFDRYEISSTGLAKVINLPYRIQPSELPQVKMEVSTIVSPDEPVVKRVPIWVIILAIVGGLLLLLLVILVLYKVGFFKRKKYEKVNTDEKRADL